MHFATADEQNEERDVIDLLYKGIKIEWSRDFSWNNMHAYSWRACSVDPRKCMIW